MAACRQTLKRYGIQFFAFHFAQNFRLQKYKKKPKPNIIFFIFLLKKRANMGDVDKCKAELCYNCLKFTFLHHFKNMRKKFVFSVAEKSRKKMVLHEANNVISVTFAVANS